MENAKKMYEDFKIDLEWRMSPIESREEFDRQRRLSPKPKVSINSNGEFILHDPTWTKRPFASRVADHCFNWVCSLFYSH